MLGFGDGVDLRDDDRGAGVEGEADGGVVVPWDSDPGDGSTFTHELYFVDHLNIVVMVSTPQEECSQSIQTASKPSGAMNLAVGTVLKARNRPRRGGILPSWASRIASRV